MLDDDTIARINGRQDCPPDAGPAWRAAHEAGVGMSLIEDALRLTREQRLAEHQQIVSFLSSLNEGRLDDGTE